MSRRRLSHFDTSHLHHDLKGHTIRSGKATIAAQVISLLLNMASVAILARLLSPADFGLIAMVTALTGVITIFRDGGLSIATVQRDTVSHQLVSNLFWINLSLSFLLALVIAAMAPAVAMFYGEAKLTGICLAVAGIFLLGGMGMQHQALLRRQMRFADLAKIQIGASSLGLASAIVAATMSAGYWALLVQMAMTEMVSLLLTLHYCRWIPGRPQRTPGTRSMVNFGCYTTVLGFFSYLGRNADNVLLGHYLGSQAVGLYSKAYSLLLMPIQQINGPIAAVAMPALSRLQGHHEKYRNFFRKILSLISFTSFPIIVWMIICRKDIILLVLGPEWVEAIPIFLVLAISALCQPVGNISGLLFVTLGRTRLMLIWGIIGNLWLVAGIVIGLPHGIVGVALGYSIATLIMMIPLMLFSIAGTRLTLADYFEPMQVPAIGVAVAGCMAWGAHNIFAEINLLFRLAAVSAVTAIVYLGMIYIQQPQLLFTVMSLLKTPSVSAKMG